MQGQRSQMSQRRKGEARGFIAKMPREGNRDVAWLEYVRRGWRRQWVSKQQCGVEKEEIRKSREGVLSFNGVVSGRIIPLPSLSFVPSLLTLQCLLCTLWASSNHIAAHNSLWASFDHANPSQASLWPLHQH